MDFYTLIGKEMGILIYGSGIPSSCYQGEHVMPYMHILMYHVPHFIRIYWNIKFSCQGKSISAFMAIVNYLYA